MTLFSKAVFLSFVLFSLNTYSQLSEKLKPRYEAHWSGMDIGVSMLMNSDFGIEFTNNPYWENEVIHSSLLNFNIIEYKIPIAKQYFGLTTGLGWQINNIGFKKQYLIYHTEEEVGAYQDLWQAYDRNFMTVHYLTAPLLLEFASKRLARRSFYFCAGVIGGVRIGSKTTLKGKYTNGDKFTRRTRSQFNLNPFFADATVRIGYDNFGLFGAYSLTTLFKKDKTVAIYPLRMGITLNINSIFEKREKVERSVPPFEDLEGI